MFHIPERRRDLKTRAEFDHMVEVLRDTLNGLMLYSELRPEDTRAIILLARCETEITHYTQQASTIGKDGSQ